MCALRKEGDEKKVQHCQVATETCPCRQSGRLEDAGARMSWLDAKDKCQGYLVRLCIQAVMKCPTVWLTETSDVVTYALCGVWWNESWVHG